MSYEFEYQPTAAEYSKAGDIAAQHLYQGWWRTAFKTIRLIEGLAAPFVSLAWVLLLFSWMPDPVQNFAFVFFIAAMFATFWLQKVLRRRFREAYLFSPVLKGQRLKVSPDGIRFDNGRSHSFVAWSDVERLIECEGMLIVSYSNVAFSLSDRMLGPLGDLAEVKSNIREWHAAGQVTL